MNGQHCIRGMRLTVRRVVEAVAIYIRTGTTFSGTIPSLSRRTFDRPWHSRQRISRIARQRATPPDTFSDAPHGWTREFRETPPFFCEVADMSVGTSANSD